MENWSLNLGYAPDCSDIGDTLRIQVYAIDKGCPAVRDSSSIISIIVDPPPVIEPPETICLNFKGDNAVRLEWDGIPFNKYFDYITYSSYVSDGLIQAHAGSNNALIERKIKCQTILAWHLGSIS